MKGETPEVNLAVIQTKIEFIQGDIREIKQLLQEQYVLKSDFEPVRKVVYGLVSVILLGAIGTLMTFVFKGSQ